MRKMIIPVLLLMLFIMSSCSQNEKEASQESTKQSEASQISSGDAGSLASDTSQGDENDSSAEKTGSEQSEADGDLYVQNADGADVKILLKPDGTFVFNPVMYDGMPEIKGTYEFDGSTYVLTPTESNAHNVDIESMGQITLEESSEGLVYSGAEIGVTIDGSIFYKN